MDDKLKLLQFYAACAFVLICLGYCFLLVWFKPIVDLSATIVGVVMLLIGYYWGTSTGSVNKSKTIDRVVDAQIASDKAEAKCEKGAG